MADIEPPPYPVAVTSDKPPSFPKRLLYNLPKLIIILASVANYWWFPYESVTHFDAICFYTINIASGVYSFLALFIALSAKENALTENPVVKKLFHGRQLYWHEIHACVVFALLVANLSTSIFIDQHHGIPLVITTCIPIIVICLIIEWIISIRQSQGLVNEKRVADNSNPTLKSILSIFSKATLVFNVIALLCFLTVAGIYYMEGYYFGTYFNLLLTVLVAASIISVVVKFFKKLEVKLASKLIPQHKIETYLSLIVTTFGSLLVLLEAVYVTTKCYEHHHLDDCHYTHFVFDHPILFTLTLIGFIISVIDLYYQALSNTLKRVDYTAVPLQEPEVEVRPTIVVDKV